MHLLIWNLIFEWGPTFGPGLAGSDNLQAAADEEAACLSSAAGRLGILVALRIVAED